MKEILSIAKPDDPLPLVFDSPHSGAEYPKDFDYSCDLEILRTSEDKFVEDLYASAPKHGGTLLQALFPRCYVDTNRAIDDIDPQLLEEEWNGESKPTARSDAGIGLIWRLAKPGTPIYKTHLTPEEIKNRIEKYYRPYHDALEQLIEEAYYKFGQVWHINCHSMPSKSSFPKRPIALAGHEPKAAEFCLGNRDGTTCGLDFTREIRSFLQSLGYVVTINDPFKGVELIKRHADPIRGKHSLQIEINRALYMDEETGEKNKNYDALKSDIDKLIKYCSAYVEANLTNQAAD